MLRPLALLLVATLAWPTVSRAQTTPPADRVAADVARLQQEVTELRQMLIQAMQVEQQHYDLLLKLIAGGRGADGLALPPPAGGPAAAVERRAPVPRTGTITGRVQVTGASGNPPVYVYIDGLRLPPVRGRSVQIVQRDKQFVPQVVAVQRGTSVLFPNADRVTHNVFSSTPRASFDLGALKAGERGAPVVLQEPGVVAVYCDMHAKMWSEVLVTPNGHFVRVDPGGSFRLAGVPLGDRVVVAWTGGAEPTRRTVALGADGATADFSLTVSPRKGHNNKSGQAYSSYGE